MAIYQVKTTAELQAAMLKAKAGDTVALASGNYDAVTLKGLNFSSAVTVTSLDPKAPAVITGLMVSGTSGVAFKGLTLAEKDAATMYDFTIKNSSNISFDSVLMKGQDSDAAFDSALMLIRSSQNVTVTNSEITHTRYGISMLDSTGINLTGNYFHDIRTDGIRGGGNSDVVISRNYFTNFNPGVGDHPDAIQFWTTNTKTSASNITITDNVIMRGDGAAVQGIFMRDEVETLPYKNVTISGNLVVGATYHGISVGNAENLVVTNNTVTGYTDQSSWIRTNGATQVDGNSAQIFIVDGVNQTSAPTGNELIKAVYDSGNALLGTWLAARPDIKGVVANSVLAAPYADLVMRANTPPPPVPVTTITGTDGADRLKAAAVGDSVLIGGNGNDTFTGGSGNTRMEGGAGDDIYHVNSVHDVVVELASGGNDTVYTKVNYTLAANVETLRLAATDLTVHGNALDNRIVGSEGADIMYGEDGDDSLQGLDGDDILDGGLGNDTLSGGLGNDKLYGGDGVDKLLGGEGNDWLWGGAGNDTLEGGPGDDVMIGGTGKDIFQFRDGDASGRDIITDFSSAEGDLIALSQIDANTKTLANEAFKFIGTAKFSNVAGELRYSAVTGGVLVQGDVNGDGIADLSIMLQGVTSVVAKDFML